MLPSSATPIDPLENPAQAWMTLSQIALSGFGQLVALNLKMARSTFSDAVAASEILTHPEELAALTHGESPLSGPAARKLMTYLSDAQGIAADSQDEINRLVTAYLSRHGLATSPSATWSSGVDLLTRLANANARALGVNPVKLLSIGKIQALQALPAP